MNPREASLLTTLRTSAVPYLGVLAVGVVVMRYLQYLWPTTVFFKGQPPATIFMLVCFVASLALWLLVSGRERARGSLVWFYLAMAVGWIVLMGITILHGDLFNHTAWTYVPVLAMLLIKPPNVREGWKALWAFAWAIAVVLVLTRLLEILGVIAIRDVPAGIIAFDKALYWLPFSGYLGLDGRWPGPFGHNGHTAMAGALLIVIAVVRWTRSSPVFIVVGVLTLLLTGGRASVGAAIAGIAIVLIFSRSGMLARFPSWSRIVAAGGLVVGGALWMFAGDAGLTGRDSIWPAFFELWKTSIWTGVGASGIDTSGGITERFGHAHNLYLDELTRYGIIGFVAIFAALGIGLLITVRAAWRGFPGPLAIVGAYAVMSLTEPRNDWIHPSVTGFLIILSVAIAGAWLTSGGSAPPAARHHDVEAA